MRDLTLDEIKVVIAAIDLAMEANRPIPDKPEGSIDMEKFGQVLELFEMEQALLSTRIGKKRRIHVSKG